MTTIQLFLAATALAAALSTALALVLRPHLGRLLNEVCASHARAGFWLAVSLLSIGLFGLLAGTTWSSYPVGESPLWHDLFFGFVDQVRAGLFGLLLSLLVVSGVLLFAIQRFERRLVPHPQA